MIRIAFIVNFNIYKWLGGYNVLKNLIHSIEANKIKNVEVILFINKNLKKKYFKDLNVKIIQTNFFNTFNLYKSILTKINIILFGRSREYENFFSKFKINLLSHSLTLGRKSLIKSFYWIPDFQHEHYPEYFSWSAILLRKINNLFAISNSTKIILSSKDSLKDMKRFSAKGYKKSFINSFYFPNFKKKKLIPFKNLKKKFNLPKNFFYIPNQYWPHKNHLLVLKSLKYIRENNKEKIFIVSSGQSYIKSSRKHFNKLHRYIYENKLENNYKYIGIVSSNEVLSLIYYSLALVNPSKFEGWNTSVMQARSMSKNILLSDIKVHKEQKYEKTFFFKNNDLKSFSIQILKISKKTKEKYLNKKILNQNNTLFLKYGKQYIKKVQKVLLAK